MACAAGVAPDSVTGTPLLTDSMTAGSKGIFPITGIFSSSHQHCIFSVSDSSRSNRLMATRIRGRNCRQTATTRLRSWSPETLGSVTISTISTPLMVEMSGQPVPGRAVDQEEIAVPVPLHCGFFHGMDKQPGVARTRHKPGMHEVPPFGLRIHDLAGLSWLHGDGNGTDMNADGTPLAAERVYPVCIPVTFNRIKPAVLHALPALGAEGRIDDRSFHPHERFCPDQLSG